MKQKAVWGAAAVAVLCASYAGATWYMGQRAQSRYQEAVQDLRQWLGEEALVSQSYERGFWTSHAHLVLQWKPPADEDADQAAAPGQPVRLTVDSTVRHGPLAGARLAAAVVETRFGLDGLSERARTLLQKTQAPTITTVHHLGGSSDVALLVPAGELQEGENQVRWEALRYDVAVNSDRTHLSGEMAWPGLNLRMPKHSKPEALPDGDDDEADPDEMALDDEADTQPATVSVAMQGARGNFDMRIENGLWLLAPGTSQMQMDQFTVNVQKEGEQDKALAALKNLVFKATVASKDHLLGWDVAMTTKGAIGPLQFDALTLHETVDRIDTQAALAFQKALLSIYRVPLDERASLVPDTVMQDTLMPVVPPLLAGLPSYKVDIKATVAGQEGGLGYGARIKSVPDDAVVQEKGWGQALLKHSVLDANVRLPKAWIPLIAQAVDKKLPSPEELDAVLGMAQAQGFLKQEADHIASSVQMDAGQFLLNGKPMALPGLGGGKP